MYLCGADETNYNHKYAHYHAVVQCKNFCAAEADF